MNNPYIIKPDVNAMTPAVKDRFNLARSGVYGLKARVDAALLAAKNPDYAALLPQVTDIPAPENSAERQRDDTTTPHHQKTLVDRLLEKLSSRPERRNSGGDKYSGKWYNEQRYHDVAYADQSRQPTGLVYLSNEAFRKIGDALKSIRAIYQNSGNKENNSSQAEYNPFRNNHQKARVLQFPSRVSAVRYALPKPASVDDVVEDAA